jgi:hypothetical protein
MRFARSAIYTAATALLFGSATAQNGTSAVPSGQVMTHVIQVGDQDGSLQFFPSTLTGVNVGDLLQFQFWPKVTTPPLFFLTAIKD